jgi:predicted phage terminase large subunit-like protein
MNATSVAAGARAELARRELQRREARDSLLTYVTRFEPNFDPAARHSKIVCDHLEALERGDIERLAIFMPPQHGKSLLASEMFPAWSIGRSESRRKRMNVGLTSYGAQKAYDFSRSTRARFEDRAGNPFATQVDPRSSAVNDWRTVFGSHIVATGVGGPLTGIGLDLLGIDDPVKDAKTRLRRLARMFLAQTRWHQSDLAGMILNSSDAHRWTVLTLPAVCEDAATDPLGRALGDVLWPGGPEIPRPELGGTTRAVFSSMYQQRPTPEEGLMFKRADFRYADITAAGMLHLERAAGAAGAAGAVRAVRLSDCRRIGTVDLATSLATKADYFVISTFAITPPPFDLVVLEVVRFRATASEQLDNLLAAHRKWKHQAIGIEGTGYQLSFYQLALAAGLPVKRVVVTKDKEARAMVASARYEGHTMFHLRGAPWLDPFESEMLTFPGGEHDDQVDTVSMAAQVVSELAQQHAGAGIRIG